MMDLEEFLGDINSNEGYEFYKNHMGVYNTIASNVGSSTDEEVAWARQFETNFGHYFSYPIRSEIYKSAQLRSNAQSASKYRANAMARYSANMVPSRATSYCDQLIRAAYKKLIDDRTPAAELLDNYRKKLPDFAKYTSLLNPYSPFGNNNLSFNQIMKIKELTEDPNKFSDFMNNTDNAENTIEYKTIIANKMQALSDGLMKEENLRDVMPKPEDEKKDLLWKCLKHQKLYNRAMNKYVEAAQKDQTDKQEQHMKEAIHQAEQYNNVNEDTLLDSKETLLIAAEPRTWSSNVPIIPETGLWGVAKSDLSAMYRMNEMYDESDEALADFILGSFSFGTAGVVKNTASRFGRKEISKALQSTGHPFDTLVAFSGKQLDDALLPIGNTNIRNSLKKDILAYQELQKKVREETSKSLVKKEAEQAVAVKAETLGAKNVAEVACNLSCAGGK